MTNGIVFGMRFVMTCLNMCNCIGVARLNWKADSIVMETRG